MMAWRPAAQALALGMGGATVAALLHFPAPWLTGPALFVSVAAMSGMSVAIPDILRQASFIVIGMTMGAGVTPETVATAARWPAAIVTLCLGLLVIMALSTFLLQRLFGFSRITAVLASTPGHLSYVLSLSTETGADIATVSIIQSIRVLTLTLAVPVVVVAAFSGEQATLLATAETMSLPLLAGTAVASFAAGWIFLRLKVPAAGLIGALAVSAGLHATETVSGAMPAWLTVPAFILMGTLIGTRFNGTGWSGIRRALKASALVVGVAIAVSAAMAMAIAAWIGLRSDHVLVAFAPGGLDAMVAMGVLLGANPAFVAAHHVSRILFLTFLMPIIMALERRHRTS